MSEKLLHIVVCVYEDDETHHPDAIKDVCADCAEKIWRMPTSPADATYLCVPCVRARMVQHRHPAVTVVTGDPD